MDDRTKLIHSGKDRDPYTGASSIPIYQVSTYDQADPVKLGERDYARGDNPTREAMEEVMAALEGGAGACAFGSGVAAIGSTLLMLKPGDHVVVTEDVYGGTYRLLTTLLDRWGLTVTFVDMSDPEKVEAAIGKNTKALFAETPSNPVLKIVDLAAMAEIAERRNLLSIMDNTFMTPHLQKPLELGFDVSVHSATKFLGGHSDLIAGVAVAKSEEAAAKLKTIQNTFGAILGPQDSWLVHRGIKTLAARMEMQQNTAGEIALWLEERPEVTRVYYPGLPDHPGSDIHAGQAKGGGAVLSFELETASAAHAFMRNVKLPLVAVSLGGVESILSYPTTMSHAAMSPEARSARGISDGLMRLSVGLESANDLLDDMERALTTIG